MAAKRGTYTRARLRRRPQRIDAPCRSRTGCRPDDGFPPGDGPPQNRHAARCRWIRMSAPEALHAVAALDTAIDPRSTESARFVRQAHRIVRDLLIARPRRYWTDFLSTIAIAYGAFAVYIAAPWFSILQTTAFIVCGLATYRAVVFTHELTHRRERSFSAFTFVWNLL